MRFPGAVRSFPHPCGGRIVPKNREEVRKRFAYQPNGVPCGVFLHTFLHRLWKSFALLCGKWERERGLAPALLAPPCRCCPRRGRGGFGRRLTLPLWCPKGWLAFFVACLPCLQFIFLPPIPPPALVERSSPAGKGETQSLFRRGRSPRHPGTEPLAVLTEPTKQVPSGGELARRCRLPPPPSPAGGVPPRFSSHALTGAAGCDILVYRTEPPRRTARKQKETPYRTAIPERRKGENRA